MVDRVRHPGVLASVCSAPKSSPKMVTERFVVKKKERDIRSMGWLGRGKAMGSSGPHSHMGTVEPVRGCCREGRYAPQGRRKVRRGTVRLRDERRICLI
jgi:hypothetical protein